MNRNQWLFKGRLWTLVVLVLVVLVSGCAVLNGTAPAEEAGSPSARSTFVASVPVGTVSAGVCLDGSASSVPDFSATEKERLRQALQGWSAPTADAQGVSAQPGLHLVVRQVLSDSFTSEAPSLSVDIPAVPGLVSRPSVTADGFVEADQEWQNAKKDRDAAAAQAAAAARDAAAALSAYTLRRENSEIAGCVSALAQTVTGPKRAIVLVSDLEQAGAAPQIAGDLSGASVLIVQACGASADGCTKTAAAWTDRLTSMGAKQVKVIRPESSSSTSYTTFFKGVVS